MGVGWVCGEGGDVFFHVPMSVNRESGRAGSKSRRTGYLLTLGQTVCSPTLFSYFFRSLPFHFPLLGTPFLLLTLFSFFHPSFYSFLFVHPSFSPFLQIASLHLFHHLPFSSENNGTHQLFD